jgi:hypothetical protein
MNYMSMSNAIQKLIPMEENQSLTDYNRVNATKVRQHVMVMPPPIFSTLTSALSFAP